MHPRPVLYAEDDENDVFLMQRAFRKADVANPLHVATDGAEAIRYLEGSGEYSDRRRFPMPSLVMLDLNLPRRSGLEVLRWIRDHPTLRALPVVIFTSSNQKRDISSAYAFGANGYLVKPPNPDKLIDLVASLRDACLAAPEKVTGWLNIKENLRPPATTEPAT
jgi:CheY-like chemotaxis protein